MTTYERKRSSTAARALSELRCPLFEPLLGADNVPLDVHDRARPRGLLSAVVERSRNRPRSLFVVEGHPLAQLSVSWVSLSLEASADPHRSVVCDLPVLAVAPIGLQMMANERPSLAAAPRKGRRAGARARTTHVSR